MTEKRLWKNIKDISDEFTRVENKVSKSMPDTFFFFNGGLVGWVELKWVNNIGNKIKFENGQERWLYNYWSKGGNGFVLVGSDDELALYEGHKFFSNTLNSTKVQPKPILVVRRCPAGVARVIRAIRMGCCENAYYNPRIDSEYF